MVNINFILNKVLKYFHFSGHCKILIKGSTCDNVECPTVYDKKIVEPEIKFDIKIQLTDHTGTLINCRFSGKSVEEALGCTVSKLNQCKYSLL